MGKARLEDFIVTIFENETQDFLESDLAKTVTTELGKHVVEEGTAIAIGSFFSAIAPRLNSIRLTYREKRFERNIMQALAVINKRIDDLDRRYNSLSDELQEKFRGLYVEWIMDNLYSEKQSEKVSYQIAGFINMMEPDTTDDIMLIFMETLNI